jgi:hypothetical protein
MGGGAGDYDYDDDNGYDYGCADNGYSGYYGATPSFRGMMMTGGGSQQRHHVDLIDPLPDARRLLYDPLMDERRHGRPPSSVDPLDDALHRRSQVRSTPMPVMPAGGQGRLYEPGGAKAAASTRPRGPPSPPHSSPVPRVYRERDFGTNRLWQEDDHAYRPERRDYSGGGSIVIPPPPYHDGSEGRGGIDEEVHLADDPPPPTATARRSSRRTTDGTGNSGGGGGEASEEELGGIATSWARRAGRTHSIHPLATPFRTTTEEAAGGGGLTRRSIGRPTVSRSPLTRSVVSRRGRRKIASSIRSSRALRGPGAVLFEGRIRREKVPKFAGGLSVDASTLRTSTPSVAQSSFPPPRTTRPSHRPRQCPGGGIIVTREAPSSANLPFPPCPTIPMVLPMPQVLIFRARNIFILTSPVRSCNSRPSPLRRRTGTTIVDVIGGACGWIPISDVMGKGSALTVPTSRTTWVDPGPASA